MNTGSAVVINNNVCQMFTDQRMAFVRVAICFMMPLKQVYFLRTSEITFSLNINAYCNNLLGFIRPHGRFLLFFTVFRFIII